MSTAGALYEREFDVTRYRTTFMRRLVLSDLISTSTRRVQRRRRRSSIVEERVSHRRPFASQNSNDESNDDLSEYMPALREYLWYPRVRRLSRLSGLEFDTVVSRNQMRGEEPVRGRTAEPRTVPLNVASKPRSKHLISSVMGATIASTRGNSNALITLIAERADMNQPDPTNMWTPMHFAAAKGASATVRLLVLSGRVHLDAQTNDGSSALFLAAQHGHVDCVRWLLAAGASSGITDNEGRTPAYIAAHEGYSNVLISLLSDNASITKSDRAGLTPLHIACWRGRSSCVSVLINAAKTDIDARSHEQRMTPLFVAAWNNSVTCVARLLAAHCDVDRPDRVGRTPLFVAVWQANVRIVRLLLRSNANATRRMLELSDSPKNRRDKVKHREILRLLLSRVNDVTMRWACERGLFNLVTTMLESGERIERGLMRDLRRRSNDDDASPFKKMFVFLLRASIRRRDQRRIAYELLSIVEHNRVVRVSDRSFVGCDAACALTPRCRRCAWVRRRCARLEVRERSIRVPRVPSHVFSLVFGRGGFLPVHGLWSACPRGPFLLASPSCQ